MLTQLLGPDHYGVINDGVVSVDDESHDQRPSNNTHRSLRQLVAVAAWFRKLPGDEANFSFHANVSFTEERIGGGEGSNVTFKLAVRKCEVVFLAPSRRYFQIAHSSIRFQNPLSPSTVQTTATRSAKLGFGIQAAISAVTSTFDGSGSIEKKKEITSTQQVSAYHELNKHSRDGHWAWELDGKSLPNGRLQGSVWDGEQQPRLVLQDLRPPHVVQKDKEKGFPPVSRVEVRCLREDIDIYEIQLKDEEENGVLLSRPGHKARMKSAEAFLKQQILQEGLLVGDLSDRFSELTIYDATIPVADEGDFNC